MRYCEEAYREVFPAPIPKVSEPITESMVEPVAEEQTTSVVQNLVEQKEEEDGPINSNELDS